MMLRLLAGMGVGIGVFTVLGAVAYASYKIMEQSFERED
jgi:hypothetical protein